MEVNYCPTDNTNMCALCEYFNSNKKKSNCNFSSLYNSLFEEHRLSKLRLIEFDTSDKTDSVDVGGSLKVWEKFFINSEIFGVYKNKDVMFSSDKIKSFHCENITEECIDELWQNQELDNNFDIMIDSGCITNIFEKVAFLNFSFHKLNHKGFYIMEILDRNNLEVVMNELRLLQEACPNHIYFIELVKNLSDEEHIVFIIQKQSETTLDEVEESLEKLNV